MNCIICKPVRETSIRLSSGYVSWRVIGYGTPVLVFLLIFLGLVINKIQSNTREKEESIETARVELVEAFENLKISLSAIEGEKGNINNIIRSWSGSDDDYLRFETVLQQIQTLYGSLVKTLEDISNLAVYAEYLDENIQKELLEEGPELCAIAMEEIGRISKILVNLKTNIVVSGRPVLWERESGEIETLYEHQECRIYIVSDNTVIRSSDGYRYYFYNGCFNQVIETENLQQPDATTYQVQQPSRRRSQYNSPTTPKLPLGPRYNFMPPPPLPHGVSRDMIEHGW